MNPKWYTGNIIADMWLQLNDCTEEDIDIGKCDNCNNDVTVNELTRNDGVCDRCVVTHLV